MPTLAQIRNAIAAKIAAVQNIGQVYAFERFAKAEKDFRLMYLSTDRILGWNVRRVSKTETSPATGRWHVTNRWQIKGFLSLDDESESELIFDGLIEAIGDAFREDETLGGLVDSTVLENPNVAGIQVEDSGPVMFAGVLCHSARLALYTRNSI